MQFVSNYTNVDHNAGNLHVGLWVFQASPRHPEALLAISDDLHQLPFLGTTGT